MISISGGANWNNDMHMCSQLHKEFALDKLLPINQVQEIDFCQGLYERVSGGGGAETIIKILCGKWATLKILLMILFYDFIKEVKLFKK